MSLVRVLLLVMVLAMMEAALHPVSLCAQDKGPPPVITRLR